jgi:mRNA interferase MazF
MAEYVPGRGDIIRINLNPTLGHEQQGTRLAVVLSPRSYNQKTSLATVCPITSEKKGYPFEVEIPDGYQVTGVVLADQIKCLDWRSRDGKQVTFLPKNVIEEILGKLRTLLG